MPTPTKKKDGLFSRHIERLKSSLTAHGHDTVCNFITDHTYIRGKKFSFEGHEYQKHILEDKAAHKVILKSAQIGISEMSARMALAYAVLVNGFSTIYTLPTASAAQNFMKTRVDPIIDSSEYLRDLTSKDVDNSSVKRFGESYLYLKGAQVDRQAISVPSDLLVFDEIDNSNQAVLTLFESRLIHSAYQYTVKLSTPTVPGYGIDLAYKQSRRQLNMCKCAHCNTWFYPDYYEHVRIPGFKEDLSTIAKKMFANPDFKWQDAYVACPKCGRPADMGPEHRSWVVENPNDAFIASGFRVSPFDCPKIILPSHLVKSSVDYARRRDFDNQRLGIPSEDSETSLAKDELDKLLLSAYPGGGYYFVMGLDMGNTCWCTIASVLPDGGIVIVHTEGIQLFNVKERRKELARQWKVRMSVVDHGPYTETVYQMQQEDQNLFAGVYVNSTKGAELFKVKDQEADKEKGKLVVRQVNITRDATFDVIMGDLRNGKILKVQDENDELWKEHLTDMKRIPNFDGDEMVYRWVKTQGNDHLHHSLLYTWVASNLLGVTYSSISGTPIPLILGTVNTTGMMGGKVGQGEPASASWAEQENYLHRRR